jgi:DNA mismatch repair protein MutL
MNAPARIARLSPLLASQIAAGEVIERPASVVKELVENAIDAGATRIAIELEGGGMELIRIADDGSGIDPADLPLAVAPHATSKVREAADLDRIMTMGFRGEALASIASIARVRLTSRTPGAAEAASIVAEGSSIGPVTPAAGPPGTTIEVRNLFYNTPARRKFLRTPATEQTRCLDWITNLALAHPAIGFIVRCEGRIRIECDAGQSPRQRVLALLGRELEPQLLEVTADGQHDARGLALWGLIGRPAIARATAAHQFVFLNGRTIRDRTIAHAIKEAYRGLIEPGRYATAVLMLELAPAAVDVNVHPAKLEVRFRDASMIHQAVLHAVRETLRASDLTPAAAPSFLAAARQRAAGHDDAAALAAHAQDRPSASTAALPGRGWALQHTSAFIEHLRSGPVPTPSAIREALAERDPPPAAAGEAFAAPLSPDRAHAEPAAALPTVRAVERVLAVHNSYLVTQDEAGLIIIDQHALHERVMYERLWHRIAAAPLESQKLITPVAVPANRAQIDAIERLGPLLARCGIEVQILGPASVGIGAFASLLFARGVDPVDFLTALLERAERDDMPVSDEEALHEVLDMMACKAAVKAGDRLADEELRELLMLREHVERSAACPHGRPTSVRVSIEQLEKLFHRR